MHNFEKAGVIRGRRARVDTRACGLQITAVLRIRLERHDETTVQTSERGMAGMDEVLECHVMTVQTDYQLGVVLTSLDAYEAFIRARLQRIGGIARSTPFANGIVKDSTVFPAA